MLRSLLVLLLWLLALPVAAHRASDAFVELQLQSGSLLGQWEIALRDVEAAVRVDLDRNGAITWGELRAQQVPLAQRLSPFLLVESDAGACQLQITDLLVNERVDGAYAWFALGGECPAGASTLRIRYRFLFEVDPSHRAIVALSDASGVQSAVLSPAHDQFPPVGGGASGWSSFRSYVRDGVLHIWAGYDHLLFLLCLLLPCVLVRRDRAWHAVERPGDAVRNVLIVVTAFTASHSITLSLSALGVLSLPAWITESGIALTLFLAALNNVWPLVTGRLASVALVFGLIHGFGFASALGETGLPTGARLFGLAGFNVGVELGQLAVVAAAMPLLVLMRHRPGYRHGLMQAGSLGVAVLAAVWFLERAVFGA